MWRDLPPSYSTGMFDISDDQMTPSAPPGHEESPPPQYSEVVQCQDVTQTSGEKLSQIILQLGVKLRNSLI